MWKFIKFTLLALLATILAVGGAAAWFMYTPVSASNVDSRIAQACMIASVAIRVDNMSRKRVANAPMTWSECSCLGDEMVRRIGAERLAPLADAARVYAGQTIQARITGAKTPAEPARSLQSRENQAMLATGVFAMTTCRAPK